MYSKSIVGHGFNPHSSYRQPALNLRPVHQIVSHGHQLGPVNVSSFPISSNPLPIYRQVNPNYSLQLSLNQLESDLNVSDSSGNETKSPIEKSSLTNGIHKERQSRSRVVNDQINHHQATGSKSLVRTVSSGVNGATNDSTPLMNSRSTGAVLDYIQKERRAHTMAPMARILGPSSEPRANLFASVIAPSDAQMIKTQPRHQTATEPSTNTYAQSNGTGDDHMTNGYRHQQEDGNATAEDQDDLEEDQQQRQEDDDEEGEVEDEDDEEDVPIVVKVRYDPETGAPPSEDAIRQAVDQQLRQRTGKRPADGTLLLDFSNGQPVARTPAVPPMSIRSQQQQQAFNRSGILPTSSNHQLPLKLSGSFQNTNTMNTQLLQQEQQRRQQMLLQQQKQKFLLHQQQQRHQLLLLQQQKEKQQLEAFLQHQKQKAVQQQILQQRLQQQQQEQQRLQQQRLKQQQEQQRLQQQRLQQQQEQQRLQQQRLQQQQQQIKELQIQQQKQRQQALQQQQQQQQAQKYREQLYQQQLQMSHIEEQRRQQNSLLPPIAPKLTHIPPLPRPNPYQRTLPTHSTSNTMSMPSHPSFPIAPVPMLPPGRANSSTRKSNLAQSHSYSGLHSLSSYAPKYVPSLFIPINFELNNGRTSITVSHQNHTEIPNYLPPRPQTAPSSSEIYRPSSVTDIPELSQDSLRTMLENIPDLHGRNFKIEYAPENIEDGYPIPINVDDRENRYTDAVIVDQLPNSIMQHVHNSNNPTLVAALSPSSTTDEFSKSTIPIHLKESYTRANISSVFVKHSMRQELLVQ